MIEAFQASQSAAGMNPVGHDMTVEDRVLNSDLGKGDKGSLGIIMGPES